jgi:membrane dipeptidase
MHTMIEVGLRDDPAAWAERLGVSRAAIDLFAASDVIDLHVESFVWTRVFGYDLGAWHRRGLPQQRWWGQVDLPRARAVGLAGAVMSIATNPLRSRAGRRATLFRNLARLRRSLGRDGAAVVADAAGYAGARSAGRLACFVAVQGGNALGPDDLGAPPLDVVSRITLVHLTPSALGSTSAPGGRAGRRRGRGAGGRVGPRAGRAGAGLTAEGRRFVEALRDRAILLDLAHAAPATFWQALDVHGVDRPVIVSHTGVQVCRRSWRNLDDGQIRAIAASGGVVGVMFHRGFLARPGWRAAAADVVRHIDHVVDVGGEDAAAIGSDFDGLIVPPRDLPTVLELPRLAQGMLDLGYGAERMRKVLGANYLRVVEAVRPGTPTAT